MIIRCIATLILLVMVETEPMAIYQPGQGSQISTDAAQVRMVGNFQGRAQNFRADLVAFVAKVNEINASGMLGSKSWDPAAGVKVKHTCFVNGYGSPIGAPERFDDAFNSIQTAINRTGPNHSEWLVVVYPGDYVENLTIPAGLSLYFYGGVNIWGNIILGNNCRLQFDCGSVVHGNIVDNGASVNSVVCGCVDLIGVINLSGAGSVVVAEGYQLKGLIITNGSLDLHFKKKNPAGTTIDIQGGAQINIVGLSFSSAIASQGLSITGGNVNLIDCDFSYLNIQALVFIDGANVTIINSKLICIGLAVDFNSGTCTIDGCSRIESNGGDYAIAAIVSGTLIIRKSYITVANSTDVNQSAIRVDVGAALILDTNTIIGKGTGFSVEGITATSIQSQFGNQSNKVVDGVNITETVSTISVNAAIL